MIGFNKEQFDYKDNDDKTDEELQLELRFVDMETRVSEKIEEVNKKLVEKSLSFVRKSINIAKEKLQNKMLSFIKNCRWECFNRYLSRLKATIIAA